MTHTPPAEHVDMSPAPDSPEKTLANPDCTAAIKGSGELLRQMGMDKGSVEEIRIETLGHCATPANTGKPGVKGGPAR